MMKFHLGDVLSVITGRNLSLDASGIFKILNFMTGDNVYVYQIGSAEDECRPYLLAQFPELGTPEMQFAVDSLVLMLENCNSNEERYKLFLGWFSKLISGGYGVACEEMLEVLPLPLGLHAVKSFKTIVEELAEIAGDHKKIEIAYPIDISSN